MHKDEARPQPQDAARGFPPETCNNWSAAVPHTQALPLTDAELGEVRREVKRVRSVRMEAQRRALARHAVRQAIEAVERDRTAMTTQDLERLRKRVESLASRILEAWQQIDGRRAHVARIQSIGFDLRRNAVLAPGRSLLEALESEATHRSVVAARLSNAGMSGPPVPEPPPLEIPEHPEELEFAERLGPLAGHEALERARTRKAQPWRSRARRETNE